MRIEFCHAALQTSSTGIPLTFAITCATRGIVAGSFRPFTIDPFCHFSFFTAFGIDGASVRYFEDACDGRMSHQGPSVSICSRSSGTSLTTARFSSVFKLQPLTPMSNPSSTNPFISSALPVKLCTSPRLGNLSRRGLRIARNSSLQLRICRNRGSCSSVAMSN